MSFAYPDREVAALSDVSLKLPAGGVIALVGENGSGKSTLVKLLCGFYRPTAGRILVDGEDLAAMSIEAWRGRVCAAFQDYANFEFVVHESVGVGEVAQIGRKELAAGALGRAGGAALAELEPGGLETMLGRKWGGTDLSGGQWQKLALARALVREQPLLVVFDEPTAALDAAAEHEMFERFAAEARSGEAAGRVTLLISHRFSTVRMADAIAVIDQGRLKEFGSHRGADGQGRPLCGALRAAGEGLSVGARQGSLDSTLCQALPDSQESPDEVPPCRSKPLKRTCRRPTRARGRCTARSA